MRLLISVLALAFMTVNIFAQRAAYVDHIDVDEETLTLPCNPGDRAPEGTSASDDLRIKVMTSAVDEKNRPLTYRYSVSGGIIRGTGRNVEWDLTGVLPGTYDITVEVDNGVKVDRGPIYRRSSRKTKSITVRECSVTCVLPPDCPLVNIHAAEVLDSFTEHEFSAELLGVDGLEIAWSAKNAEVIKDQGTHNIRIKTGSIADGSVKITLKLNGMDPEWACNETTSIVYEVKNGRFLKQPREE